MGPEFLREIAHDLVHDEHGIVRIGGIFADEHDLAPVLVEARHVGKCAANVDADPNTHQAALPLRSNRVASSSMLMSVCSTTP